MSPSRAGVRVVGSGAPGPDDSGEAEVADAGTRADEQQPQPRPWLLLAVSLVALAGIIGTIVFATKWHALASRDDQRAAVAKTSTDFLKALTNFDAATVDADFNRVESYAVGHFKDQANQFFSSDVRKALAKVQAVSRGQIRDLYVESIHGDQASVYASVDQTIANINFKSPEQDQLRIVLTLSKQKQGWRISDVTVLQAPAVPTPVGAATGANPVAPGAATPSTTAAP